MPWRITVKGIRYHQRDDRHNQTSAIPASHTLSSRHIDKLINDLSPGTGISPYQFPLTSIFGLKDLRVDNASMFESPEVSMVTTFHSLSCRHIHKLINDLSEGAAIPPYRFPFTSILELGDLHGGQYLLVSPGVSMVTTFRPPSSRLSGNWEGLQDQLIG